MTGPAENRRPLQELLEELEAADLLRRLEELDLSYLFKNQLTQEATYQSLLLRRRRELHRGVAQYYETQFPDRLDEHAALLAQHYAEAGDDERALAFSRRAAMVATRLHAHAEAMLHFDRALAIALELPVTPDVVRELFLGKGRALELGGRYPQAMANYEQMERLGAERGDPATELAAIAAQATVLSTPNTAFDPARARAVSDRALDLARSLGDRVAEARILWNLMLMYNYTGRPLRAVEHGVDSLAIARELGLREQLALTLTDLSRAYQGLAQYDQSLEALREARSLLREQGNLVMLADNLNGTAEILLSTGRFDDAIRAANEAFEVAGKAGNSWGQAYSRFAPAFIHVERGEFGSAIEMMEESIRLAEQGGFLSAQVEMRSLLAFAYTEIADPDRAMAVVDEAIALALEKYPIGLPLATAVKALIHLERREIAEAEATIKTAGTGALADNAMAPAVINLVLALVSLATGKPEEAVRVVEQLVTSADELGVPLLVADGLRARRGKRCWRKGEEVRPKRSWRKLPGRRRSAGSGASTGDCCWNSLHCANGMVATARPTGGRRTRWWSISWPTRGAKSVPPSSANVWPRLTGRSTTPSRKANHRRRQ